MENDNSLKRSVPDEPELYGVRIKKLATGKYLAMMEKLRELPEIFIREMFPDMTGADILLEFSQKSAADIVFRFLAVAPKRACLLISELLDMPENRLTDLDGPDALSLAELAEIIDAFWEKNDMTGFFGRVRRWLIPAAGRITGSNDFSPSGKN